MNNTQGVLDPIWSIIRRTNKYIDETAPWVLAKDLKKKSKLESVMNHLVESLRIVAILLEPIMPYTSKNIFEQLGIEYEENYEKLQFGCIPSDTKVIKKGSRYFLD